jgi:hypothetical protein
VLNETNRILVLLQLLFVIIYELFIVQCGPDSVVDIATGYGLDGPGIESWWGKIFRTCPDRPWGPPSLLYYGYRVFSGGKERPGRDADPSPPSGAVGHERVELYLYSLYGPYGLYRASVPVQGCTLLFTTVQWLLYVPLGLILKNSTFCPHGVFMCCLRISEQTAINSLYSIN